MFACSTPVLNCDYQAVFYASNSDSITTNPLRIQGPTSTNATHLFTSQQPENAALPQTRTERHGPSCSAACHNIFIAISSLGRQENVMVSAFCSLHGQQSFQPACAYVSPFVIFVISDSHSPTLMHSLFLELLVKGGIAD